MIISDNINLHNCDCMQFLKEVPDKYYQLAIVDPPYGVEESTKCNKRPGTKGKYHTSDWDKKSPNKEYFDELFRVSENQIIWGANHFISKMPYDSPAWVIWDKKRRNDFADCEMAWTSFKSSAKIFDYLWDGYRQQNMLNKEIRIHPTQKPVDLYLWLLKQYAKKGDKIIDTHLGSMSIVIAAYERGFYLDGCELDNFFFTQGLARVNKHINKPSLFKFEDFS